MKKKIITLLLVAAVAMLAAVSCDKNKFGTYKFFSNTVWSMASQEKAAEILAKINEDSYFTTTHSYEDNYDNAVKKACDEFTEHCNALDDAYICSRIKPGESFTIQFWCTDPGNCWLRCVFTSSAYNVEEE